MNNEQRITGIERDLARLTARVPLRQPGNPTLESVEWSEIIAPAPVSVGYWVDETGTPQVAPAKGSSPHSKQIGLVISASDVKLKVVWSGETSYITSTPPSSFGLLAGETWYQSTSVAGQAAPFTSIDSWGDYQIRPLCRCLSIVAGVSTYVVTVYVIGRTLGGFNELTESDLRTPSRNGVFTWLDYGSGLVTRSRRNLFLKDLTCPSGQVDPADGSGDNRVYVDPYVGGTSLYPFTASASDTGKVLTWVSNIGGTLGGGGWVAAAASAGTVAWSSVTGTPTNLSGYGITDPVVLTSGSYANPAWITSLAASKLTGGSNTVATNTTDTTNAAALTISGTFDNWTLTLNEKRPRFNAKWIQGNLVDTVAPTTNGDLMMWHAASSSIKWVRGLTTRGDLLYGDPSANYGRLPVGTAGQGLITDGTDVLWGKIFGADRGTATSSTVNSSSTVPAGKRYMIVELISGGGGGGRGMASATAGFIAASSGGSPTTALTRYFRGAPGNTGSYVLAVFSVTPGATIAWTIGSGGAAAASDNSGGSTGGDSTFTLAGVTVITAYGGPGGNAFGAPTVGSIPTISGAGFALVWNDVGDSASEYLFTNPGSTGQRYMSNNQTSGTPGYGGSGSVGGAAAGAGGTGKIQYWFI